MAVRIGIIAYASSRDVGRVVAPVEYIQAVERAGAHVLIAPPGPNAAHMLELVDGLVLVGGGDIDPKHYGAERHPSCYGIDEVRDATESAVIRAALSRRMPMLAVCRGMQMLNVVLGGSLIQHLPDVVGDTVQHRTCRSDALCSVEHDVRLAEGSALTRLCGGHTVPIASTHHQAVDRLGAGVRACAWAADNVIEAISLDDHPEVIAVQWHPELTAGTDARQQRLFDWLHEASSQRTTRAA